MPRPQQPQINWDVLAEQQFRLPDGANVQDYLPAAFKLLQSPKSSLRDGIAYPALATWLENGLLDEQLAETGTLAIRLFAAPAVHSRSFAALILAEVISRDTQV